MAIIVDKNGNPYSIFEGVIQEPPADGQIFDNLKSLAVALNSLSDISSTNFGTVQSTIQSANSTFNVFAIVTHQQNSESLVGATSSDGKRLLTQPRFIYNINQGNKLSTGKDIVDMSGGLNYNLSEIDGKKWMAMAVFDGTYSFSPPNGFRGIMIWIFTGELISSTNSVIATGSVTSTSTIFYPSIFTSSDRYRRIYQIVLNKNGGITASNVSGNGGWLFSSAQNAGVNGYLNTTRFSADDGIWAFRIGEKVNGDNPGPHYMNTNGYGMGNYNTSDIGSYLYWNGSNISSTKYVGFVFTGDA